MPYTAGWLVSLTTRNGVFVDSEKNGTVSCLQRVLRPGTGVEQVIFMVFRNMTVEHYNEDCHASIVSWHFLYVNAVFRNKCVIGKVLALFFKLLLKR